jgi:uncharacterized protein (TIGR00369 family)
LPALTHAQIASLLRRIAFNKHLGMRLVRMHPDGVTISCAIRQELLNAAGVLHGGVTATLADVAVGMAVVRDMRGARAITTVEMKVNYLRAVTGRKILARSRLVRVGSTLAIGKVDLHDDQGRLVAIALVTYMILASPHPLLKRAVSPATKPRRSRGKPR